ncbi:MAG: hypothetical protein L6R41_006174 [Letrouitia leprolyta]|nr:MAG: hypothetical protein L6R41_006174 [Letrouitia leprolyta]
MGLLDIIVAILRIVYLVNFVDIPDFTWNANNTFIWSVVESGLATIIACAPTLRIVFTTLLTIAKKDLSRYPVAYPRRLQRNPDDYSNISNGEVLLRPFPAFSSQEQGGNPFEASTTTEAATSSGSTYSDLQNRVSDPEVIRVQQDVSIHRGPKNEASTMAGTMPP